MTKIVLVSALFLEIALLVGFNLWLGSMPEGFIQGFGAGAFMFVVLGALVTLGERKGY